jgi:hypothetical protein
MVGRKIMKILYIWPQAIPFYPVKAEETENPDIAK